MTSVIIPIHNILKRGQLRVFNSVYSLINQPDLEDVIIVDSSSENEFNSLQDLLSNLPLDKVRHIRIKSKEFNKPLLLNTGIQAAKSEWIMCTDADYIFKKDFLETCKKHRKEDRIIFKEVKMLRNQKISMQSIDKWKFPQSPYNEWGHLANGACQYAKKEFFVNNPYPENMVGFGAMDNMMAYIAYNKGLEIYWLKDSEIFHQFHKPEKFRTKDDLRRFNRNQEILKRYIKENDLPKLLKKTR